MISHLRHARWRLALATVFAALALPAAAAQADLVQGVPQNITGTYFDDHSISGDDHRGWDAPGSQAEPVAITFGSTLTNTFGGPFRVCGYDEANGWLRAYEMPGLGACPGAPTGTQDGWFRYVTANHSDATPPLFNRWHLMDLQRFALVPLAGINGPVAAGQATAWDTGWGTCISNGTAPMECVQDAGAEPVPALIGAGATKITQEYAGPGGAPQPPAPDATRIAIPTSALVAFPDGYYQVVAIANPRGAFSGAPSYACATIRLTGVPNYTPSVTTIGAPATCYVPTNVAAVLVGPGVRDPLAGATPTDPACPLLPSGHCWPGPIPPQGAPNLAAQSNVNSPTQSPLTATAAVALPQPGGTVFGASAPPAATPPGTGTPPTGQAPPASRRMTVTLSRTHARVALRKQFGRNLSRLRVSCRVRSSTASTCRVSWRKSGATYKGNVWLRYRTVRNRLRWQYRIEVKKKKAGRTQTVRRAYRTGGTF